MGKEWQHPHLPPSPSLPPSLSLLLLLPILIRLKCVMLHTRPHLLNGISKGVPDSLNVGPVGGREFAHVGRAIIHELLEHEIEHEAVSAVLLLLYLGVVGWWV